VTCGWSQYRASNRGEESKAKKAPAYAGAFALRDGQKAGATYQPAKKRPAVIQVATAFGIEQ